MCYFNKVFTHKKATVDVLSHQLKNPVFGRVDTIVGMGMSGVTPLMAVSLASGVPFAIVRKSWDAGRHYSEEGSHSDKEIENGFSGFYIGRYVIIDDFVDSGKTIVEIIEALSSACEKNICVGVLLYQSNGFCANLNDDYPELPFVGCGHEISDVQRLESNERTTAKNQKRITC